MFYYSVNKYDDDDDRNFMTLFQPLRDTTSSKHDTAWYKIPTFVLTVECRIEMFTRTTTSSSTVIYTAHVHVHYYLQYKTSLAF